MMVGVSAAQIIGGDSGKRKPHDFYPTPPDVTQALLDFWHPPERWTVWEPAAGDGAMANVLDEWFDQPVQRSDIQTGTDFLSTQPILAGPDLIITNPPFSLAEEFIWHARKFPNTLLALILKSQFWHAKRRLKIWEEHRPSVVYPLTWRPDFDGRGAPTMDVMWCVWSRPADRYKHYTVYQPLRRPV